MAQVYVEGPHDPSSDPTPMLYISIDFDKPGAQDDAELSFETRKGFGFRIRERDAAVLAELIRTKLSERERGCGAE